MKVVQVNLHKSKAASAALLLRIAKSGEDIALIQEPWTVANKVCGLGVNTHILVCENSEGRPRSCILIKRTLSFFMLSQFSNLDITSICVKNGLQKLWISSIYEAYDKPGPTNELQRLAEAALTSNVCLVIGGDINAHHSIWGSSDVNLRGESYFEFILASNLAICNKGCSPTFSTKNREEVLDVTLTSQSIFANISNWMVSEEHSFSDHKYIEYSIESQVTTNLVPRNLKKTNWEKYKNLAQSKLRLVPNLEGADPQELDKHIEVFNQILNEALDQSCPIRASKGKTKPPWWTSELKNLQKESRKLFNKAKKSGAENDWLSYKNSLRSYKTALRQSKRKSLEDFCKDIESTSDIGRLRKLLSSKPSYSCSLKKCDGSWTDSFESTLELLADTHFPVNTVTPVPQQEESVNLSVNTNFITPRSVKWAINSFKPYKSPGPDGVIPAQLQQIEELVIPWLVSIYKQCLRLNYVPKLWRETRVVFIPKAGKIAHINPKDFRPISLSSFLLKVLERLIDHQIKSNLDPKLLSVNQHAYTKGRSVETALHSLITSVENSMSKKEVLVAGFVDVEGAFNNVLTDAITNALADLEVEPALIRWIRQLLLCRFILPEMGGFSFRKQVNRGTPQGGVLSPLLWNVVVNKLLTDLEGEGCRVIAYADDIVVTSTGKFPETTRDLVQRSLNKVSSWSTKCGLAVNPKKTEVIMFTNKHKIPDVKPIKLNGVEIPFKDRVKYLGLILDRKLTWKDNLICRIEKASTALYTCRQMVGKKWGLSPKITYWIYTAIVRPILTYGCFVWWNCLNKVSYQNLINKVQRSAGILITGAMKTTSSNALNAILNLMPLDLYTSNVAAVWMHRLKGNTSHPNQKIGHMCLPEKFHMKGELDCISPVIQLQKDFQTIYPTREDWKNPTNFLGEAICIFTDGSKINESAGAGVYSEELNIKQSLRLPDHCSVFQAEIYAILTALNELKNSGVRNEVVAICSDSQAAIKALSSFQFNSDIALRCRKLIDALSNTLRITLYWVPGHSEIGGNCMADELARAGTCQSVIEANHLPSIPLNKIKTFLANEHRKIFQERWTNSDSGQITKSIWPKINRNRTTQLLSLSRMRIQKVVGVITGHCMIGAHSKRLGLKHLTNDFCRSCRDEEEEETILHFLGSCPALCKTRKELFGFYFTDNLSDFEKADISSLSSYIERSNWF